MHKATKSDVAKSSIQSARQTKAGSRIVLDFTLQGASKKPLVLGYAQIIKKKKKECAQLSEKTL